MSPPAATGFRELLRFPTRLERRIAVPRGYARVPVAKNSFAAWLRGLPLKPGTPPVYLYNGQKKANQGAHCAVVNIDTGKADLQQCADAVIRLLPGALGSPESAVGESFGADGLLEYPQYTRPEEFRGMRVPEVLLSGDHGRIAGWRQEQQVWRTMGRRPDLLTEAQE